MPSIDEMNLKEESLQKDTQIQKLKEKVRELEQQQKGDSGQEKPGYVEDLLKQKDEKIKQLENYLKIKNKDQKIIQDHVSTIVEKDKKIRELEEQLKGREEP